MILHDNRRTQLLGKVFSIQLEENYLKRMIGAALRDSQLRGDSQETSRKEVCNLCSVKVKGKVVPVLNKLSITP
jgi:hypothetical protein